MRNFWLAILSLALVATANADDSLVGVYGMKVGSSYGEAVGSFNGGEIVYVATSGITGWALDEAEIKFAIGNSYTVITPEYIQPLSSTRFEFKIPSLTDLIANPTESTYSFQISVVLSSGTIVCDTSSQCAFTYSKYYTPRIERVFPSASYISESSGQDLYLSLIPFSAVNLKPTYVRLLTEIEVGDYGVCDFSSYVSYGTTFYSYEENVVRCRVKNPNTGSNELYVNLNAGAATKNPRAKTYFVDGSYYVLAMLPAIKSVSPDTSYTSGGQTLTITGEGFSNTISQNEVSIAGYPCDVTFASKTSLKCTIGRAEEFVQQTYYPGGHGLDYRVYSGYTSITTVMSKVDQYTSREVLATTETLQDRGNNFVERLAGYFKAPFTGKFRFYVTADATAQLYFSTDETKANLVQIIDLTSSTGIYDYFSREDQKSSQLDLVEGNYYYFEAYHLETAGTDHFSLGFDYETTNTIPEALTMKTLKSTKIVSTPIRETITITIHADIFTEDAEFTIYFPLYQVSSSQDTYDTYNFTFANRASQSDFQDALEGGLDGRVVGSSLTCKLYSGAITTSCSEAYTLIYKIIFTERNTYANRNSHVYNSGDIEIEASEVRASEHLVTDYQAPSVPLDGTYSLTFNNLPDIGSITLENIDYDYSPNKILQELEIAIPLVEGKLRMWENEGLDDNEEKELFFHFIGFNEEIQDVTIGVTGLTPAIPITTEHSTLNSYSATTMFVAPIPYNLLYTIHELPQVQVKVNDVLGVCVNEDSCDFTYDVNLPSQIESFTFADGALTLNGQGFTSITVNYLEFADVLCTITSTTDEKIEATCVEPVAGTHSPILMTPDGIIPIEVGVLDVDIGLTLDAVEANIYFRGGYQYKLTGSGFPHRAAATNFIIYITEDTNTCGANVDSSSSTEIFFTPDKLTTCNGENPILHVVVNGKTASSPISITMANTENILIQSISPSSINPAVKTNLYITVENLATYAQYLDIDNYHVSLVNNQYSYNLNVRKIEQEGSSDQAIITVRFPGAVTGDYEVQIYHDLIGYFLGDVTLNAETSITSISINEGSYFGGSSLTIEGTNFCDTTTENTVTIANYECPISSATTTELVCDLSQFLYATGETVPKVESGDLKVFLKLAEEATCADCSFTFSEDKTPEVTAMEVDSETTFTITGTKFDLASSLADIEVTIEGYTQNVVSYTATTIVVEFTNIYSYNSVEVQLKISPYGYAWFKNTNLLSLDLTLKSLNMHEGSEGGSILELNVFGFGRGLRFDVVHNTEPLCETTEVSFFKITCKTVAGAFSEDLVNINFGLFFLQCDNENDCKYHTSSSLTYTITAIDAVEQMDGDYAISIDIDQTLPISTQAVEFQLGSLDPVTIGDFSTAKLVGIYPAPYPNKFKYNLKWTDSTGNIHYFTNAINVSPYLIINFSSLLSTSSVTSSIAGGKAFEIICPGLPSSVEKGRVRAYIDGDEVELTVNSNGNAEFKTIPSSQETIVKEVTLNTYHDCTADYLFDDDSSTVFDWLTVKKQTRSSYASICPDQDNYDNFSYKQGSDYYMPLFVGEGSSTIPVNMTLEYPDITDYIQKELLTGYEFYGYLNGVEVFSMIIQLQDGSYTDGTIFVEFENAPLCDEFAIITGNKRDTINMSGIKMFGKMTRQPDNLLKLEVPSTSITTSVSNSYVYQSGNEFILSSLDVTEGSTAGGDLLTFIGENIPDASEITITIDEVECSNIQVNPAGTQMTCTTGARTSIPEEQGLIIMTDAGLATYDLSFIYSENWSQDETWGGEFLPEDGDTVYIPKGQTLVMDIATTPYLNLVLVEGTLIIPDTEDKEFHANNILVYGGKIIAGSEETPFTHKLTFTLHALKTDSTVPLFGGNILGVYLGTLQLYGTEVTPWMELSESVYAGETSIYVMGNVASQWKVGDTIVIAPTDTTYYQHEERVLTGVSNMGEHTLLQFTNGLAYSHLVTTIQDSELGLDHTLRGEVGLLSRNIVIQGEQTNFEEEDFGAIVRMMGVGTGVNKLIINLRYVEFRYVGQKYKYEKYAVHFDKAGSLQLSDITGCSVHHSANRGIAVRKTHYLTVERNVVFYVYGHGISLDFGIEDNNVINENLVIYNLQGWATLFTDDHYPAGYYITSPKNYITNNRAAGSYYYGFNLYYRSYFPTITSSLDYFPVNYRLSSFEGNTAHSIHQFGIYMSRYFPQNYEEGVRDNAQQIFIDNTIYANRNYGLYLYNMGEVTFSGGYMVDNYIGAIVVYSHNSEENCKIQKAVVIGQSGARNSVSSPTGIYLPQSNKFTLDSNVFYNFPAGSAITTCAHCNYLNTGAFTTYTEQLKFSNVAVRVKYNTPYKAMIYDRDGTLLEGSVKGTLVYQWKHLEDPDHCTENAFFPNAWICDSTNTYRALSISNIYPYTLRRTYLYITRIDSTWDAETLNETIWDYSKHSEIHYSDRGLGYTYGWKMPMQLKTRYHLKFNSVADPLILSFYNDELWETSEDPIVLSFYYTEDRDSISMTDSTGNQCDVTTDDLLTTFPTVDDMKTGTFYSNEDEKTMHFVLHSNAATAKVNLYGVQCKNCIETSSIPECNNPKSWSNYFTDIEAGDDLEILIDDCVVLDINPLRIGKLSVNGYFSIPDDNDYTIDLETLVVRGAMHIVGDGEAEFSHNIKINFLGPYEDYELGVRGGDVSTGFFIQGQVKIKGLSYDIKTYLLQSTEVDASVIYVDPSLSFEPGDQIAIGPGGFEQSETEIKTVQSYDPIKGEITLNENLLYAHQGYSFTSTTSTEYKTNIRSEVALLKRNIIFTGPSLEEDAYRPIIQIADQVDDDIIYVPDGYIQNVKIENMGNKDAPPVYVSHFNRYIEINNLSNTYTIQNCVITETEYEGVRIQFSENFSLLDNILLFPAIRGVIVTDSAGITVDGNLIFSHSDNREFTEITKSPGAGFVICTGKYCENTVVTNNIVAGANRIGFFAPGIHCSGAGYDTFTFENNVAHAAMIGWIVLPPADYEENLYGCYYAHYFKAYKTWMSGIFTYFSASHVTFDHIIAVDNNVGITLMTAGYQLTSHNMYVTNCLLVGEWQLADGCPDSDLCETPAGGLSDAVCHRKTGLKMGLTSYFGKEFPLWETNDGLDWDEVFSTQILNPGFYVTDTTFRNFLPRGECEVIEAAIVSNEYTYEYAPIHFLEDITFENVDTDALIYLNTTPSHWLTLEKCGELKCTGNDNILLKFTSVDFTYDSSYDYKKTLPGEVATTSGLTEFQIMSNNPGVADTITTCTLNDLWNAYYCSGYNIGHLNILNYDGLEKTINQIEVSREDGFYNFVNGLYDFVDENPHWDEDEDPLPKYASLVEVFSTLKTYHVAFEGTTPYIMDMYLSGELEANQYALISLTYDRQLSVHVFKDNQRQTEYVGLEANFLPTTCGENLWYPETDTLVVLLTGKDSSGNDCVLKLKTVDSIMLSIRMEMTVDEFMASDGTTLFIDRLANVLNIHPSRIRIVSITSGSTKIVASIDADSTLSESETQQELDQTLEVLKEALNNADLDLGGGQILDYSTQIVKSSEIESEEEEETTVISWGTDKDSITTSKSFPVAYYLLIGAAVLVIAVVITVFCIVCKRKQRIFKNMRIPSDTPTNLKKQEFFEKPENKAPVKQRTMDNYKHKSARARPERPGELTQQNVSAIGFLAKTQPPEKKEDAKNSDRSTKYDFPHNPEDNSPKQHILKKGFSDEKPEEFEDTHDASTEQKMKIEELDF